MALRASEPVTSALVLTLAFMVTGLEAESEPEPEVKTSLAIETPEESWRRAGFRVSLGYMLDGLLAVDGPPDGAVHTAIVRVGARLDEDWSLFATLRYGVRHSRPLGLRYSGTVEPTVHLFDGLTLAVGVGVAGFVITETEVSSPEPESGIVASYTLPEAKPLLGACLGAGVIALLRADYVLVSSDLLSYGPTVQFDTQWTGCVEQLGRSDPDTGEPILLRQYWQHFGASVGFAFWWR